jgi:hypothetical protein
MPYSWRRRAVSHQPASFHHQPLGVDEERVNGSVNGATEFSPASTAVDRSTRPSPSPRQCRVTRAPGERGVRKVPCACRFVMIALAGHDAGRVSFARVPSLRAVTTPLKSGPPPRSARSAPRPSGRGHPLRYQRPCCTRVSALEVTCFIRPAPGRGETWGVLTAGLTTNRSTSAPAAASERSPLG